MGVGIDLTGDQVNGVIDRAVAQSVAPAGDVSQA